MNHASPRFSRSQNLCVTFDPASALDPARLEARLALAAQSAALAGLLDQLERSRSRLPSGAPTAGWRGPAQRAYGASVRQLAAHLDEAVDAVRGARALTARAVATIDAHG